MDFVKYIIKNTEILENNQNNNRQFLFRLRQMLLNEETDIQSYFEKLLNTYIYTFLLGKKLDYWKCYFSEKNLFKSITITLLSSFQINKNPSRVTILYYSKISLLNTSSTIESSWKVFVENVLKKINNQHGFNSIKDITSFKIAIVFEYEEIEKHGFISGNLVNTKFDEHNKLIFFPYES